MAAARGPAGNATIAPASACAASVPVDAAPPAAVEVLPSSGFFLILMPATPRLKHQGGRRYSLDSRTDVDIRPIQK